MPSGKVHDQITLFALPLVGAFGWVYTANPWGTLLIICGFFFSAFMFNGDLDLKSLPFYRWGWLRFLWLPYQKLIPHRSHWSHGFLVGTLIRIFYLWLVWLALASLLRLLGISPDFLANIPRQIWDTGVAWRLWQPDLQRPFLFCLLIGLELGAMSHSLADYSSTSFKRAFSPVRSLFSKKSRRSTKRKP